MHVGIVNGKMKREDVEAVISSFVKNEIQILISTTVIEVGVNVPNATVMVVEQSNRFGLASLHQLRGRVGRSSYQSYCILLCDDPHNERVNVMVRTNDGFEIAEADLAQRGSGDLLGIRQAGHNRFIDEMLRYPVVFQMAVKSAERISGTDYEAALKEMYGERAESVGEDI